MTALTPNLIRPTADGQRVRVVADAVVSSYINELAGPPARRPAPRQAPVRSARMRSRYQPALALGRRACVS